MIRRQAMNWGAALGLIGLLAVVGACERDPVGAGPLDEDPGLVPDARPGATPDGGAPIGSSQARITEVEKLEGSSTSTSIQVRSEGEVWATYWRCEKACLQCATAPVPGGPCSAHRLAVQTSAGVSTGTVDEGTGEGTTLLFDEKSQAVAASLAQDSSVFLHQAQPSPSGIPPRWTREAAGSGAILGMTWLWARSSQSVIAWVTGHAERREISFSLDSYIGYCWAFVLPKVEPQAAFDGDANFHMAWAEPDGDLQYQLLPRRLDPEGKQLDPPATESVATKGTSSFQPLAVAVDASGRPHVLYQARRMDAQFHTAIYHAVRSANGWVSEELAIPVMFNQGPKAALAFDSAGKVHFALVGSYPQQPVTKESWVNKSALLVGRQGATGWSFQIVDQDATGAVSIAVSSSAEHVAYFGEHAFKLATLARQ